MILITGASGSVGRSVLEEIRTVQSRSPVALGRIRAMYRNPEESRKVPAGVASVTADFANRDSLAKALEGVDIAYLVCSPIPELVQLEHNFIEAAMQASVSHIVLSSALGAKDYPKSFPAWHRKVEDKLKSCGVAFTILQPNSFMQNISAYFAPSIRAQNVFYCSMGNAKTSFVDVRDIASAATRILLAPAQHAGKTYELNGPEALSYEEVAARISRLASRRVQYVDIPFEAQHKALLDMAMPIWQVNALLDLQRYYVLEGKGAEVTGVLEGLLGRPPIHFDQFLDQNKDSFRSSVVDGYNKEN
jgi:uncharacterized protein YbjT (DUF2867 family)